MDISAVTIFYKNVIETESKELTHLKKRIFQIGSIRLVIFIACIIGVYSFWGNIGMVSAIIGVSTIAFLGFMKYHNNLFKDKRYCELMVQNAQNELKALNYDFSAFQDGNEYTNAEHSFSLDLDIFGDKSFFQSINRTVTSFGKNALADILLVPLNNDSEILIRQAAIKELSSKKNLLLHFRALGQITETTVVNRQNFSESLTKTPTLANSSFWKAMIYFIPSLYIILSFLVGFNILSSTLFLPLYLATFAIAAIPGKKVANIKDLFEEKSNVFETYSNLLKIIEDEKFESSLLKDMQQKVCTPQKSSVAINKLKTLNSNIEMAFAYPMSLLLTPILLWNVRSAISIEKWSDKYGNKVDNWFASIAEFDALVSLSTFAFNHPDYTYPKPTNTFTFKGKDLGHPLINREVCVRNDIDIEKTPYFLIVTGANMAGKSTYLRTIGINHLLACCGSPVCANSLSFYPNQLVTNLRTADSLADNESYFFAELKRLKMIIDRLTNGEQIFIILDEILKGTNSEDKRKGSIALMRQLVSLNGNGIIATHDLELGQLQTEYPEYVKNYCFEADITNDHLSFTYKIREGIAQNMNATFLMRKMGITGL